MTTAEYNTTVLFFDISGRKIMEQTSSLEIAFSVIRMVFLFFNFSKTMIESSAMIEDHVTELLSRPVMKSDPLR